MKYVMTTDKFMSGWGMAEGLTNVLIFECETMADIEAVTENIDGRSDFTGWRVLDELPKGANGRLTWKDEKNYYQVKDREEYPNFYCRGYFTK